MSSIVQQLIQLKLIFIGRVLLLTKTGESGHLASDLTGWVSHGIVRVEPLKSSIGGLPKQLVQLTVLSTPILFFLPQKWPLYRADNFHSPCFQKYFQEYDYPLQHVYIKRWDVNVMMDPYFIEELYYWKNNLNYIEVQERFLIKKPQHFAYCDASVTGYGSVISLNEDNVCPKLWEPSEPPRSTNWREA